MSEEMIIYEHPAEEALRRLKKGNAAYVEKRRSTVISDRSVLLRAISDGQKPEAIIVSCSDSRVIPEALFDAAIGDLFVIRVAGNVIDDHQLGSIEYAAEHLGTGLVVVLGHNHCGAVDAALYHHTEGYIQYIVQDIVEAIGDETDEFKACCLNVQHSCARIEQSLQIQKDEREYGLRVVGAIYNMETGEVEFLEEE